VAETVLGWVYESQAARGLRVYSGPETRTRSDEEVLETTARDDDPDEGYVTRSRGDERVAAGPQPQPPSQPPGTFTRGDDGIVMTDPKPQLPPATAVRGDEDITVLGRAYRSNTPAQGNDDLAGAMDWDPPLTHSRGDEDVVLVLAGPDPQPDETKARGDD
jgi:hypothetical protein